MVKLTSITLLTRTEFQLIKITDKVRDFVKESGILNGLVTVISAHTTTGIIVNEGLDCVEIDMEEALDRLVPKNLPYAHAHFLPSYGATGSNAHCHLKSMLTGNNCMFVVQDGHMLAGSAQDIYFTEFDGPNTRTLYIQVIGE
jgi:secondary thiamine-phosphate synthase enzyme